MWGGELNPSKEQQHDRRFDRETIRCAHCANLALLLLDGVPVCHVCAAKATVDRDIEWIERHSASLDSKPPPKIG